MFSQALWFLWNASVVIKMNLIDLFKFVRSGCQLETKCRLHNIELIAVWLELCKSNDVFLFIEYYCEAMIT